MCADTVSVRREFPYQVTEQNKENNKMTTENTKSYVDLSSNVSMDELLNGTEKSNNFAEGSIVPGKIVVQFVFIIPDFFHFSFL